MQKRYKSYKNRVSFQWKLIITLLIISMITFTILNYKFSQYQAEIGNGYIIVLLVCTVWLNILAYKDNQNELLLVAIKIIMYLCVFVSIALNQLGIIEFGVAINIFTSFVVLSEIASLIREFKKKRSESSQNSCGSYKNLHIKENKIVNCKLENVTLTDYEMIGCSSVKACTINECTISECNIEDSIIKNSELKGVKK